MTKTKKKLTKKPMPKTGFAGRGMLTQSERTKIDVRVGDGLDARIEAVAKKLGTTKNSIVVIGTLQFVAKLEALASDKAGTVDTDTLVKQALKVLVQVV